MNVIGFSLLGLCFVIALGRIAWSNFSPALAGESADERVQIRFAHWQLEGGVRSAFDEIAERYMELHPEVEVVQLPIPDRIYPNWLITQLVGETAPELIQLGIAMNEERRARFFEPLTEMAELPNPYNAGTDLEGVPLVDTFIDGMQSGFSQALLEFYGAPVSAFSIRVFYNLELLKKITGSEELPKTYGDVLELAEKTRAYSKETGIDLVPIAGSKYNSPFMMERLFKSQTEQLADRVEPSFIASRSAINQLVESYHAGEWSLDSPEIRAGLGLLRELGDQMQPGFTQLSRDDATFYFVQELAVMIASGSWDATSITADADFPVAVGYIPVPEPGHPTGPFSLGGAADSFVDAGVIFGIPQGTKNAKVARDFLLFLVSQQMNQLFTDLSQWPPSVLGVEARDDAEVFTPFLEGYLGGFPFAFSGADTARVFAISLNKLIGPQGSVDSFIEVAQPLYGEAMKDDLTRRLKESVRAARRTDTTLGALSWQLLQNPDDEDIAHKLDLLLQSMHGTDQGILGTELSLERINSYENPQ